MPLKNRKEIIEDLRTIEFYFKEPNLSENEMVSVHNKARDAIGRLVDTFDKERKRPKGGRKGGGC